MSNEIVIHDPEWFERFQAALAKDTHTAMGVAWSYLLATLAKGPATEERREELRIRVTRMLVDEVHRIYVE